MGDRPRLAQATGNLIANALEHGGGDVAVCGAARRGRRPCRGQRPGPGPGGAGRRADPAWTARRSPRPRAADCARDRGSARRSTCRRPVYSRREARAGAARVCGRAWCVCPAIGGQTDHAARPRWPDPTQVSYTNSLHAARTEDLDGCNPPSISRRRTGRCKYGRGPQPPRAKGNSPTRAESGEPDVGGAARWGRRWQLSCIVGESGLQWGAHALSNPGGRAPPTQPPGFNASARTDQNP